MIKTTPARFPALFSSLVHFCETTENITLKDVDVSGPECYRNKTGCFLVIFDYHYPNTTEMG